MPSVRTRVPLSRERVLEAALHLADESGLEALTMRSLGKALGVEAMSLYNHVAGKDDILDGIVERVLDEIVLPSPDADWKQAMRDRAESARQVFTRHPWAIGLLEARAQNSSAQRLDYYDRILGALRGAGFPNQLAMRGFSVLDAYLYGFILQERSLAFDDAAGLEEVGADLLRQMADAYPHLTAVTRDVMASGYDFAAEFRFGLDLILDALERRRDAG